MELKDSWSTLLAVAVDRLLAVAACSIIALPTWSPARAQMSTTLL
jgi:hypothetical protein